MLSGGDWEAVYRAAVDRMPVPLVVSRRSDHRILMVNAAFADYLRRPVDDLIGTRIDDFAAAPAEPVYERASDGEFVFEHQHLRGDGTVTSGRVHAFRLPDVVGGDDDDVFIATVVDMSAQSASTRRSELLLAIAPLIDATDIPDLATAAARVEELIFEHLGVVARIDWWDPVNSPLPARDDAAVAVPITVDHRTVGRLVLEIDDYDEVVVRPYVEVLASYAGAIHVVVTLRSRLRSSALFEVAFDVTRVGIVVIDRAGVLLRANTAFARMVGRPLDQLIGSNWRDFTPAEDISRFEQGAATRTVGERLLHETVIKYVHDDGKVVWADFTSVWVDGPLGDDLSGFSVVHLTDVTARIEALEAEHRLRVDLEASERRYRSLVEPAVDLIARLDARGGVVDVNHSFASASGVDRDDLSSISVGDLLPDTVAAAVMDRLAGVVESNERNDLWREWIELRDRTPGWYVLRLLPEEPEPGREVEHVMLVASEITEVVENEQRLAALALVDPLTGLANRAAVHDRLDHALARLGRRRGVGLAVAVIDLDHFKAMNDTYGHGFGDEALRLTAEALARTVRNEDTVGRLGGDEFVVVLEEVPDRDTAAELGDRFRRSLCEISVALPDGNHRPVSGSVGIAFTDRPVPGDDLLARADRAMYQAKTHGRSRTWLEQEGDSGSSLPSSGAMLRELAAATSREQFRLHYQPIADASDGSIVGFEALLRWEHPRLGLVPPAVFLEMLLSTGQIGPVGRWVLRTAVRQLAEWQRDPRTANLHLNVNACPSELAAPGYTQFLGEVLCEQGVDPGRLHIEVTEQSLAGTVVSSSTLSEIASVGARLVLDDFGTGVSSLSHLRTQPLHGIKIDRSFVKHAVAETRERAITDSIMYMASSLELEVTAEGVETPEQLEWLTAVGCHRLQGYHIGRPMPLEQATALIVGR